MSVLFIRPSCEVLHCSDRVLVMRDRHVLGEYRAARLTKPACWRDRGRCAGRCR